MPYQALYNIAQSMSLPAWLFHARTKFALVAVVPVLVFGYIFQINNVSTSGYTIHTLERQVATVAEETQRLSTQVAESQSMVSIQKRLPELAMVKTPVVTFVDATHGTPVAQR